MSTRSILFRLFILLGALESAQAQNATPDLAKAQEAQKKHEASLSSPIPSTYLDLGIPNSHEVLKINGVSVYRGMRPRFDKDFEKITRSGVKHILTFRMTSDPVEVQEQFKQHEKFGIKTENLHYIPFPWRRMGSFEENCKRTLVAIGVLEKSTRAGESVFFHCTVGEDRTGALSGLIRILWDRWTPQRAFEEELCARGFSRANPQKPEHVSAAIERELQPFFFKMAYLLQNKNPRALNDAICNNDPALTLEFNKWLVVNEFRTKRCVPLDLKKAAE